MISNGNWSSQQQLTPQSNVGGKESFSNPRQTIGSTSNQLVRHDSMTERKIFGGGNQGQQMENVILMRQFCVFYHYYLI